MLSLPLSYQFWSGGLSAVLIRAIVGGGSTGPRLDLEVGTGVGLVVLAGFREGTFKEVLQQFLESNHMLIFVDQSNQLDH